MLNPDLNTTKRLQDLAAAWNDEPCMRIESVFPPDTATAIHDALHGQPFTLVASPPANLSDSTAIRFQYYHHVLTPQSSTNETLNTLVEWINKELPVWVGKWTQRSLTCDAAGQVLATLHMRGCYLDPHNDWDGSRAIAYIFGLTPSPWPESDGGFLEFLNSQGQRLEQRPPGWNTLDIFDVTSLARIHQVPLLRSHRHRWTIPGWLYPTPSNRA